MNKPIGIFDSGVGGLTVAKAILKLLPNESFLYFADTKNLPYGERSPEEIEKLALRIVSFLVYQGIKLLAIACNYSSAVIFDKVKKLYPFLPVVGVLQAGASLAASFPA
ncbi:MAG: glutamate racemase, partial [bacterium]